MATKLPGNYAPDGSTYVTLSDGSGTTSGPGSAGNVSIDQTTPGTTNAVAIEGQFLTTPPSYSTGTVNLVQTDSNGSVRSVLISPITTGADNISNAALSSSIAGSTHSTTNPRPLATSNYYYNGTSWDRQRGDTNGAYSVSKGTANIATAQVSVSTTATQIVAARAGRAAVTITNLGTTDVFVGITGVTTTTGTLLLGAKGSSVTIPTNAAVFGIVGTGTQSVSVLETY